VQVDWGRGAQDYTRSDHGSREAKGKHRRKTRVINQADSPRYRRDSVKITCDRKERTDEGRKAFMRDGKKGEGKMRMGGILL